MTPLTIREIEAIRSEYEPGRQATPRERRLLAKHGTPVRLPIDDAVTPPPPSSPRPAGRGAANGGGEGNNKPGAAAPISIRPAALGPKVDNGRVNLTTPPVVDGVLARTVQIPRPRNARLEAAAEPVYAIVSHEARVLIRVLDQAAAAVPERGNFWAVPWQSVVDAFQVGDAEVWEAIAAAHKAVDELCELQVACVLPGHRLGVDGSDDQDNAPVPVLFISGHTYRQMLRSMVLADPDAIPLVMPSFDALTLARRSFNESSPPRPAPRGEASAHADGEGSSQPGAADHNTSAA